MVRDERTAFTAGIDRKHGPTGLDRRTCLKLAGTLAVSGVGVHMSSRQAVGQQQSGETYLYVEAESASGQASFAPFEVFDDSDASSGQYIEVPDPEPENYGSVPEDGRATYSFDISEDGTYSFWLRGRSQNSGNSFYINVDAERDGDIQTGTNYGVWEWHEHRDIEFTAGSHTVTIIWRESGMNLDRLLLTSDGDFEPSGTGGDSSDGSDSGSGDTMVAINAGGSSTGDYVADTNVSSGGTYTTSDTIDGTDQQSVYQSERYGTFSYAIPVENGDYDVTFQFAEIYNQIDSAGERVFSVDLNGSEVLTDFDIYAEVGADTAIDRTFTTTVENGEVNLTFKKGVQNPKVSGIVVVPSDDSGSGGGGGGETDTQSPYGGSAANATERVEAEFFDESGESVAYSDDEAENLGSATIRDTGVDIQPTQDDDGYNVGWMEDGEWLEYTVNTAGGTYDIDIRVASNVGPHPLTVSIDGTEVGTTDIPDTGGWQSWQTVTLSGVDVTDGEHVVRLGVSTDQTYAYNVGWFRFTSSDSGGGGTTNDPPRATFDCSPESPAAGDEVSFDASGSSDSDGSISSYEWSFGDGSSSTGQTVSHTYDSTGDYSATLTVTDDDGATGSTSQTVTVGEDSSGGTGDATVSGTQEVWHRTTLTFDGPSLSETADPNPFLDYRLQVQFDGPSGQTYDVPGYYAGDGSGGESGNKWRCHFAPDESGDWSYTASFREGDQVAVSLDDSAGSTTAFDGASGTVSIGSSSGSGRDFRASDRGLLVNRGNNYLTFPDGTPWIKGGPDIPENFMAPDKFDSTHGGRKGAIDYIADRGCNSIYFLPNNVGGDGDDTWPHISKSSDKTRYDTSKLATWRDIFEHAESRGVLLHFVLSETESANENYYDNGTLGPQRKLFYRELIARFGHVMGVEWNLGEENDYSTAQHEAFANYLHSVDPYDHPVSVHIRNDDYSVYENLLGNEDIDMTSFQTGRSGTNLANTVAEWRSRSADSGVPWAVSVDEGTVETDNLAAGRRGEMWPTYMAGGGGYEWYIKNPDNHNLDQNLEDYSRIESALEWTGYALGFMNALPVEDMAYDGGGVSGGDGYLFGSDSLGVYACYLPDGDDVDVDVVDGTYEITWLNPRTGEEQAGTIERTDYGEVPLSPPFSGDAAARLDRV